MTRMEIYDGCFLPNLTGFVKHTSTKPIPHPSYSKQRGGEGKRNVRGGYLVAGLLGILFAGWENVLLTSPD